MPSKRAQANEEIKPVIRAVFLESRATYGSPRVHFELRHQGRSVGRHRVARLMREMGLSARFRRRKHRTAYVEHGMPVAENRFDRRFGVRTPDSVWATDITYINTREGWLYLAVVMDLFSRRTVGWSMTDHMRTSLVRGALEMALGHRVPSDELLHHSDRGSQYASWEYQQVLKGRGIECSMSRERRAPRQCGRREPFRHAETRIRLSLLVDHAPRSAARDPRLHRSFLQSKASTLLPGEPVPSGV